MIKNQQFPHTKYTYKIHKLHSHTSEQSPATFKEQHLRLIQNPMKPVYSEIWGGLWLNAKTCWNEVWVFCTYILLVQIVVFNNMKHIIFYGMNNMKIWITSYKNCKSNLSEQKLTSDFDSQIKLIISSYAYASVCNYTFLPVHKYVGF
jgi:hypothetical protein